jgi:aminoglycoside phosphotransferase (APT) family kinase protein
MLVEREALALHAARESGCPVPRVGEITTHDGRPALVMQRASGPDLLTRIDKRPWLFLSVAQELSELHSAIHRVEAPSGIPELKQLLQVRIEAASDLSTELSSFALGLLASLPAGDRLLHGDFHPGNVLADASGPLVIDWINAAKGDPVADVARTQLLFQVGEPVQSSPMLRVLIVVGRRMMLARYLRGYRRNARLPTSELERWAIVNTAARVAESIPGELPKLIEILERARAKQK